jgi:hypothetical protein
MITPTELDLLERLADGAVETISASIDPERGQVVYPEAEAVLDGDVAATLTAFADHGLLEAATTRDCTCVLSDPHETIDLQLTQYAISDRGERWVSAQRGAIDAASDLLEGRGYQVAADATLTGTSGEQYRLHLHAEDELIGTELVVGLAPETTADDVLDLRAVADDVGASPVLLTTGDPSAEVRDLARDRRVNVLRVDEGAAEPTEGEELAAPE